MRNKIASFFVLFFICVTYFVAVNEAAAEKGYGYSGGVAERRLGVGFLDFGYEEFSDSGAFFDGEYGPILGLMAGYTRTDHGREINFDIAYFQGDVFYNGFTQPGNLPITSRTDTRFLDLSMSLGQWFTHGFAEYELYGGVGYRYWWRKIRDTQTSGGAPVSGLYEHYRWGYLYAGAKYSIFKAYRNEWLFDARIQRTLFPTMDVYWAPYDDTRVNLGEEFGHRLAFIWRFSVDDSNAIDVTAYRDSWEFGRSPDEYITISGAIVGTVHEPRSETNHEGINVQWVHRF